MRRVTRVYVKLPRRIMRSGSIGHKALRVREIVAEVRMIRGGSQQ